MRQRITDTRGEERWFRTVGVPVSEDGKIAGLAGISSDVTELVENERQLEEQVEQLDQFASMISHDLRSPLSAADLNLELYRAEGNEERLDDLGESLEKIETLVEDLLSLVKGTEEVADTEPVSLAAVSDDAWTATESHAATLETDETMIEADRSQLETLLENLFRNAVDHGGADVTVRVGSLPDGFFVEDTGTGIDTPDHRRLFEHGYTNSTAGTGVGLTIVQRIANAHDWEVSLTESEEGGARFEFRRS